MTRSIQSNADPLLNPESFRPSPLHGTSALHAAAPMHGTSALHAASPPHGTSALHAASPMHGGLQDAELAGLGLDPSAVLDLSVNVNPYGPCTPLLEAIHSAPFDRYPDPYAHRCRCYLAEALGVAPERIVVGNGAAELLWLLARVLLRRGDAFLTIEPTFSEMVHAARRVGATCHSYRLTAEQDFVFDAGSDGANLELLLERVRPRVVYLCSPNNPSGTPFPVEWLVELSERHPATRFVVDLSFDSLSDQPRPFLEQSSEQVLWVRSLTKDLALPGLRLGYCVLAPGLPAQLEAERPPWSVNAAAQAAIRLSHEPEVRDFVARSRARLSVDREQLSRGLTQLGFTVHPSGAPFCLAHVGNSVTSGALRTSLLARHQVLVRDATSFGLPHHIRVAARPARELERLFAALREQMAHAPAAQP